MSSETENAPVTDHANATLWRGLIDDAAVFPPGNYPVPEAVANHHTHRTAWYADMVGPLLLPVPAVSAFHDAVIATGQTISSVALAVRPGAASVDDIAAAVARLEDIPGTTVTAVETALPKGTPQGEAVLDLAKSLHAVLPERLDLWLEVHSAPDTRDAMSAIRQLDRNVGAKYRMGGTEAAGFPTVNQAFTVLEAAATTGVRLKLTAGLHHLHRYQDPELGATHHGFGNVMACLHALLTGQSAQVATEVLADPVPVHTTAILSELRPEAATALRSVLASFGCCGVTDPIDHLVAAGLLQRTK